ncbi:general substrate transporter [Aspergillus cavernicola]|uniref:General substrate transporter n=1 Tax=Aspergillus cavernicola TaxID=176166 RepID=A0ABR4IET4_9EURO
MLSLDFAKGRLLYRLMSVCCCLAFGMYGYDAGVLGGVQETKPFRDAMGNPTGTYIIPMIASSYTLAAAVCSLITSVLGMPLGRRGCILLGDILVIVGGSLQASAWSVAQMIVGRVICGFGIGFISCAVPTYMAEMSITTKERGPEIGVQCIFLVGGCAVAYWIDFGFTRMDNQISWRFPIGFQTAFALVSAIGMFLLPDTPRWYYARGRHDEGDKILARLHDCAVDDEAVQEMRRSIVSSIEFEEESKQFNVLDLFWDRTKLRVGHRIRVAFLLLSMQQMMGINLSVYYSTIIFGQIGLSSFLSQLLAAVMNTTFALGSLLLPGTIERFGRRKIMIYSAVGLTICMTVFVAMIGLSNPTPATQWTAVSAAFLYNFIFGYGWIGVAWLYGPEIAPLRFRHVGGAAAAFGEWLFCFITVFAGGIGLQNVGWKMWLWCLLSCAAAIPFVYYFCPETTGKTLEEIDLLFTKEDLSNSASNVGSWGDEGKEGFEFEHEEKIHA